MHYFHNQVIKEPQDTPAKNVIIFVRFVNSIIIFFSLESPIGCIRERHVRVATVKNPCRLDVE